MSPRAVHVPFAGAQRLSPRRVVALSAAFTIHVIGYGFLAMPVSTPVEQRIADADPPMVWIEPQPKPKPLPAMPVPPKIERAKPKPRPQVEPVSIAPVVENATRPEFVPDIPAVDLPPAAEASGFDTGVADSGEVTILNGPIPRYPRAMLRRGIEGEVLLKVLVDERGRATEVVVLQSSGHRALDDAARVAVKKWRFKAAVRNGVPVQAYGTVPVVFSLSQG